MRLYKKLVGKHVVVQWVDITTYNREPLSNVKLSDCEATGKVVEVKPNLILCHDTCGELGDYTIMPSGVVTGVEVLD